MENFYRWVQKVLVNIPWFIICLWIFVVLGFLSSFLREGIDNTESKRIKNRYALAIGYSCCAALMFMGIDPHLKPHPIKKITCLLVFLFLCINSISTFVHLGIAIFFIVSIVAFLLSLLYLTVYPNSVDWIIEKL